MLQFSFLDFLLYPLSGIFQTSCSLTLTPTHSFQIKDGEFVSRAQVSSQQKKVARAGVKP
jgi:hypothetical protein